MVCPQCGAQLQVPKTSGIRRVACPRCNYAWTWRADELLAVAPGQLSGAARLGSSFSVVPILRESGAATVNRRPVATDASRPAEASQFSEDLIKAGPARRWLNILMA